MKDLREYGMVAFFGILWLALVYVVFNQDNMGVVIVFTFISGVLLGLVMGGE